VSSVTEVGPQRATAAVDGAARRGLAPVVRLQPLREAVAAHASTVLCSTCRLRTDCLPAELERDALKGVDGRLASARRKVTQGEPLFRAGDRFDAVFAVWTGFFKTVVTTRQGREQVTGFQMAGDLMGFDGVHGGRHAVDAIALEDSQICVIPFAGLQTLAREAPMLQERLHSLMSREIVNDHSAMLHLGSMYAEERLAAFLIDLSRRLEARGYSGSSLLLRMSRGEIGSYLGLKLETVSRAFSRFQAGGLLHVCQRQVRITDAERLRGVLDGAPL
jgi:CRP/FNR family transcriptional regulator